MHCQARLMARQSVFMDHLALWGQTTLARMNWRHFIMCGSPQLNAWFQHMEVAYSKCKYMPLVVLRPVGT